MRNYRTSRRYAQALFSLALDHGRVDDVSEDLDRARRALDELPGARSLFTQPLMPDRLKRDLVDKVFGDAVSPMTRDFLHVVVARSRADLFDQIREQYTELRNDHYSVMPASVRSAARSRSRRWRSCRQRSRACAGRRLSLSVQSTRS